MKHLIFPAVVLFFLSCKKEPEVVIKSIPMIRPEVTISNVATKVIINGYEFAKVDYQIKKIDDVVRIMLPTGNPYFLPLNELPNTLYVKLDSISKRGVVNFQYKMKDSSNMASIIWQYFY